MATVYVYVMDSMADWEIGYAMAELNSKRYFKKDAQDIIVKTVSYSKDVIHSMGGLTIIPDCTIGEMIVDKDNMLILPGANEWNDVKHSVILKKAAEFFQTGAGVSAICGATVALAGMGLLDEIPHTSNGVGFLDMFCPVYKGKDFYIDEPAVKNSNLITAGSTGGLLMAKCIFEYLDVFSKDTLEAWYAFFSTGKAEYFYALMQSVQNN